MPVVDQIVQQLLSELTNASRSEQAWEKICKQNVYASRTKEYKESWEKAIARYNAAYEALEKLGVAFEFRDGAYQVK